MQQRAMAVFAAAMILMGSPASADVGLKDVQVVAKTLGFTNPPLSGSIKVAIVFDPALPQSQKDADDLKGILGAGLAAGAATLVPTMVPVAQLDASLDGVGVVFITGGMSSHYDRIFTSAKGKKLLSVSNDVACVQAGRCIMGVKSDPKVEIIVNKTAADASSVGFAPAFRMMISEI